MTAMGHAGVAMEALENLIPTEHAYKYQQIAGEHMLLNCHAIVQNTCPFAGTNHPPTRSSRTVCVKGWQLRGTAAWSSLLLCVLRSAYLLMLPVTTYRA